MKLSLFTIMVAFQLTFMSVICESTPGQMIITGFKGTSPQDNEIVKLKKLIAQKKVGGIILFKRNIKNKPQVKSLIRYLTKDTPIFVVIDHEGGLVNRLTHESFQLKTPSPELFCKLPKSKQSQIANEVSSSLRDIGINVNLGGVVDIAPIIHPSSICKHRRCFSSKDSEVSACTSTLFKSHQNHGVYFALKHFPGHGSTATDSHYQLPNITQSFTEYEIMPYHQLINPSFEYGMVMMGHLMNGQVDPKFPASLSKNHINVLKNTLNYSGLIITDDLTMGALSQISTDKSKLATMAAKAGNHLLLFEYLNFNDLNQINTALKNQAKTDPDLKQHIVRSVQQINFALTNNT